MIYEAVISSRPPTRPMHENRMHLEFCLATLESSELQAEDHKPNLGRDCILIPIVVRAWGSCLGAYKAICIITETTRLQAVQLPQLYN